MSTQGSRPAANRPSSRRLRAVIATIVAIIALLPVAAGAYQRSPDSEPASLLVTWQTADGETFRAVVTDAASIERITTALAGDGYAGIPLGVLAHGDGGVNAPHAWHLLDVTVVDMTIELCDGTVSMVDADVDYWVDVVGRFCPWSATVVAAEPLQSGPAPTVPPATEPAPTATPSETATAAPTVAVPVESPAAKETEPGLPPGSDVATTSPPSAGANGPAVALPDTGSGTGVTGSLFPRLLPATSAMMMSLLLLAGMLLSRRGSRPGARAGETG